MSVYVNTEVAEDSLLSDLMQCFLKTDFKDDKFPNISRRMKELKHGEEDEKMCKSVEEYAERKAKEAAQKAAQKAAKEAAKETARKTVEKLNDMGMDISLIASVVDMDEETIKQWLDK
jgi:predicted transposase YdaD